MSTDDNEPIENSEDSNNEEWYEGYNVIPDDTPLNEYPEEDEFHLVCRVDGCDCEERIDNFLLVQASGWTELGPDNILKNGDTLHRAYCPDHSFGQSATIAFEKYPEEANARFKQNKKDTEYAKMDFHTAGEVKLQGTLLVCDCDDCLREEEFETREAIKQSDWSYPHYRVGTLADGRSLKEAYCPEHSQ